MGMSLLRYLCTFLDQLIINEYHKLLAMWGRALCMGRRAWDTQRVGGVVVFGVQVLAHFTAQWGIALP